jgi:AmiR/NasT family two-component response regulator
MPIFTPLPMEKSRNIRPSKVATFCRESSRCRLEPSRNEVDKLRSTLETRKVVDRAKGVLMKRGMDEPSAFRRLQKLAMDKRKSLREVAEAILMTEE